ncbi:hypothetical protein ADM99_04460 [Leptolinea tardivitalis]|uniref:Uncharacterized protein n=1 Tax=Leptolinea tardivitalis TaxID=229920 RepID=A0A0P6XE57_9CHLR|nr:hypothetical protein ADM99_04460 [Leptolinea tardivitalis]
MLTCVASVSFLHPDCTVDPGISPGHARGVLRSWVITTDRELRLLPRTLPRRKLNFVNYSTIENAKTIPASDFRQYPKTGSVIPCFWIKYRDFKSLYLTF